MKKFLTILAVMLAPVLSYGQDSLALRVAERQKPLMAREFSPQYTDISILYTPWLTGTTVQAGYNWAKEKNAVMTQNGDGLSLGEFRASSLKKLGDRAAAEGGVSYQRGVKRNVLWNSTSDFELLYPYIMADTVGGNLQKEQYAFYGRYAAGIGSDWKYGLSGSYRALHEYRQTDPRPRNITSDLSVGTSAGRQVGSGHVLSIQAGYRRYHQLQAVAFMSPRGANTAEFHMTGLASDYGRFTGTGDFTNLRYRGSGFSLAALLQPHGLNGLSAGISYKSFKTVRHLANQNEVPYTELLSQNADAFASFRHKGETFSYGAILKLAYELRLGSEAVVPAILSSGIDDIPWLTRYRNRMPSASLRGVLQWQNGGSTWALEPYAGAEMSAALRKVDEGKMTVYGYTGGCSASYVAVRGRLTASIRLTGLYTFRPEGKVLLPASAEPFMFSRYIDIYSFFTENLVQGGLQAFVSWSLGNLSVFMRPELNLRMWGDDGRAAAARIDIGIEF